MKRWDEDDRLVKGLWYLLKLSLFALLVFNTFQTRDRLNDEVKALQDVYIALSDYNQQAVARGLPQIIPPTNHKVLLNTEQYKEQRSKYIEGMKK